MVSSRGVVSTRGVLPVPVVEVSSGVRVQCRRGDRLVSRDDADGTTTTCDTGPCDGRDGLGYQHRVTVGGHRDTGSLDRD